MQNYHAGGLALAAAVLLVQPAFASVGGPGPVAGIGLPAFAIIGGAYWLARKLLRAKK
jgi:hypothetical protein